MYQVLTAETPSELVEKVTEAQAEGWACQGGVAHSSYRYTWENERKGYTESEPVTTFAQAMVK